MHMCVCLCVVPIGAHACGHEPSLVEDAGNLVLSSYASFPWDGSVTEHRARLAAASSSSQPISGPASHSTEIISRKPCVAFYAGAKDLNSGLQASQQMFLPDEPSRAM